MRRAAGFLVLATASFGAGAATAEIDSEEQAFLIRINQYRAAAGLGTLVLNTKLTNAAEWMSADMAAKNYMSHTDSLGRDPGRRIAAFGYTYNTWWGENIAGGYATADAVFTAWKNSSGHNANMLGANYKVIGIARAYGAGSRYGWYWTTDFGGYNDEAAPALTARRVATTTLNVRGGPGTGYAILGTVLSGQLYVQSAVSGAWSKIWFDGREGWCYSSYLTTVTGATAVKVNTAALNVRTGPGTGYTIAGKAYQNQVYVWTTSTTTGWYRICWGGSGSRYVFGSYVVRVAL